MNYFVVKENDTGNICTLDTVWPREELERVSMWDVISQHSTKKEAREVRKEFYESEL